MTSFERKIFLAAIDKFGVENQCIVAIEELSELQKELTKMLRGDGIRLHIVEEIADVEIMLDQLKLWFCAQKDTEDWRKKKIERLRERVEGSKDGSGT